MEEKDVNAAIELYNKYVNMCNVIENGVKYNLKIAEGKLAIAYDVVNRNMEFNDKSAKMKELEDIQNKIKDNIRIIDNLIMPQIKREMQKLKNEYGI